MHWGALVLIAIAGNLDNAGVGVAYGLRRIRIGPVANGLIAAVAFAGTALLGLAGGHLAHFFPPAAANALGAAVIMAIGIWVTLASRNPRPDAKGPSTLLHNPALADKDASGDLSLREAFVLAVALGLNAWAGGLGAGLLGMSWLAEALLTALASFAMLAWGDRLGSLVSTAALGRWAPRVAGVLLLLIGLHQLIAA